MLGKAQEEELPVQIELLEDDWLKLTPRKKHL